jgi:hypothetical protein
LYLLVSVTTIRSKHKSRKDISRSDFRARRALVPVAKTFIFASYTVATSGEEEIAFSTVVEKRHRRIENAGQLTTPNVSNRLRGYYVKRSLPVLVDRISPK